MSDGGVQRKLSARSAILSAMLGAHPAEATTQGIITIGEGLGYAPSTVRVALTRMVAADDLERVDGVYRLAPRLIERQSRQDAALTPHLTEWSGSWRIVVVTTPAVDAVERATTRDTLLRNHFGELREGVWTRPDNTEHSVDDALAGRISTFSAVPDEPPAQLAQALFDPAAWSARARELLADTASAPDLTTRFAVAAAVVGHLLRDPLLPTQLCPQPWPGADLRLAYTKFRDEFSAYVGDALVSIGD